MGALGNDPYFRFHPPYAQQKYHNISCFWEKQPRGCLRISCAFHHSKPRCINGLFLPPTNNAPLQQAAHQGILHPGPRQQPHRNQHNTRLPIHPPLIINLQDDEDDEEEEENYVPDWVPKTAEEIEEERAIKEICYKSGEYYRIQPPHEHPSTTAVSSPQEKELSPVEATHPDLQKETRRKSSFDSAGPPLSAYIVSPAFAAKPAPKFSEATAGPESHGLKGPEQKNQLHTKTRPGSQVQNYDKSASGASNSTAGRKRNPDGKTSSPLKTTLQSQDDVQVHRKGDRQPPHGKKKQRGLQFTRTRELASRKSEDDYLTKSEKSCVHKNIPNSLQ